MKKLITVTGVVALLFCLGFVTSGYSGDAPVGGADDPVVPVSRDVDAGGVPLPGSMVRLPPGTGTATARAPAVDASRLTAKIGRNLDVVTLIDQLDEELVLHYLEDLVDFGPRVTESNACQQAGQYIYDEFEKMGLDVRFHHWSLWGMSDRNVEATIHADGPSDEIYIVCAHYDAVSGSPGADDNGSGSALVLALAHVLSQCTFENTVRFVTFSGEEQGLLGSFEYAEDARNAGENIVAVLNADMVGNAPAPNDEKKMRIYDDSASSWITIFTDNVATQYMSQIDLDVIPSGQSWGSDHYAFQYYNFDAVFYHEWEFSSVYHSPQDTIANMNPYYNMKCAKLSLATLAELAGPFEMGPLYPDDYSLDAAAADTIAFSLDAGSGYGSRSYLLCMGMSGTVPGTPLPGGFVTLPLNRDILANYCYGHVNNANFVDFSGTLDANGQATAQFNTLGPLPPGYAGEDFWFAFACDGPWDYVSNPVFVKSR